MRRASTPGGRRPSRATPRRRSCSSFSPGRTAHRPPGVMMDNQPAERSAESPFKGKTGLQRLLNATRYSLHGFASAFRQEVLLAAILIPIALLLDVGGAGKAMMIASVLLVLIVELLNSAIETAVDRISFDQHRLSKRAKDIGSAAVALSLVNVAVVWL